MTSSQNTSNDHDKDNGGASRSRRIAKRRYPTMNKTKIKI